MVNRLKPHVLVLPEDDADGQLANGFVLHPGVAPRAIQILPEAGGWNSVLSCFVDEHVAGMDKFPHRFMILLIDFDRDGDRLNKARARIPLHLKDRVFVLGVWSNPEDLKRSLSATFEQIGTRLAQECRDGTGDTWEHDLLRHNSDELYRLRIKVMPMVFPAA